MSNISEIRTALDYVNAHDRDLWLKMGAALKDELGEEGFPIWDQWSSSSQNYNSRSTQATWKSLDAGHIRINTLFYTAIQNGFQPTKPTVAPSAEEMAKRQVDAEQKRLQTVETQKQAQEKAKQTAQYIWQKATPADLAHPYLVAKGVTEIESIKSLKQNHYKEDNNLLIPVYQNKEIVSVQFINQDGNKRLLTNGQIKGSYSLVGDAKSMAKGMYLAEGFATAASIHQATGKPVVVAFNAGNLHNVAQTLKQNYPEANIIIAADNDVSQTGLIKAEEALSVLGDKGSIVLPEFTDEQRQRYQQQHGEGKHPSDFNDLHELEGLDHLKNLLNKDTIPIMETPIKNTDAQAADQAAFLMPEEKQKAEPNPSDAKAASKKEVINSIEPDMERLQQKASTIENKPINPETFAKFDSFETEEQVTGTQTGSQKHKEPEATPSNTSEEVQQTGSALPKKPLNKDELNKIITDLNYKMPPAGLERRYLVASGQYLSADNGTTVLFEDKGKKLSTARTDTQVAQDMLEVAKTKGWDAIKLSGTAEFKQMMYVLAESQGIKTSGYKPTEADYALVDRMREDNNLNSIEEKTNLYTQETAKNQPASEKGKKPSDPLEKTTERSKPDVEALSKADKMLARGSTPTTGQIETSPKADTDVDIPLSEIGQGKISSDVINQAKDLKTHALDTEVVTSTKASYDKKASKLSKPDQEKLKFFERNTMDAIRGLDGEARQNALKNYYEHMSDKMNGKTLDVAAPLQVPSPRDEQARLSERNQDKTQDQNQDQEIER